MVSSPSYFLLQTKRFFVIFLFFQVTLIVPGEFEISLTLLGQKPTTKWTLLNIRFLVEDYEIGFGTQLIHPLQVNSVHNLLQLRMDQSEEVFNIHFYFVHFL